MYIGAKPSILFRFGLSLLVMLLMAAVVAISYQDFIISSGSDALTIVARPPLWAQIVSIFAVSASLQLSISAPWSCRRELFLSILIVSVCTYLMSVHCIIVDSKVNRIRDNWALIDVQILPFDPVEGLRFDTRYSKDELWLGETEVISWSRAMAD